MKKTNDQSVQALAKNYLKIVQWSDEDGRYVGTCPGLMLGGVHGDDKAKVYAELCQVVDEVIELKQRKGHPLPPGFGRKQFNGKFLLRISPETHRLLAVRAYEAGESINSFAAKKLEEAL